MANSMTLKPSKTRSLASIALRVALMYQTTFSTQGTLGKTWQLTMHKLTGLPVNSMRTSRHLKKVAPMTSFQAAL
jgi:hypothetical protein